MGHPQKLKKTGHLSPLRLVPKREAVPESCREAGCATAATASGYCRAHYIKNWSQIKRKQAILADGKLRRFITELIRRAPEPVVQALRHDLSSDEALARAMSELGGLGEPDELGDIEESGTGP